MGAGRDAVLAADGGIALRLTLHQPEPERSAWGRGLSRLAPTGVEVLPIRAMALDTLRRAALVWVPVVVVATVGVWLLVARTSVPVSDASAVEPGASSPGTLTREEPTPHASVFRDVATPERPAQSGTDALPYLPSLPASEFATAMHRNEESRLRKEEKPTPPPRRKIRRCIPLAQTVCTAGVCTLVLTGCANTPQVLPQPGRPLLKPAECPPGAEKTMIEELGLRLGQDATVRYPIPGELHQQVAVREGPVVVELRANFGKLPGGTRLHGELLFGPDRVQGRFSEARTPEGRSYPVCMEFAFNGRSGGHLYKYNEPDIAIVMAVNSVYPVHTFGYRP